MARKPSETGILRTAPEAAALPVERSLDSSRRPEATAADRRRRLVGIVMLAAGLVLAIGAMIALGTRVGPTAEAVRGTELDAVATFFLGTDGSALQLVLVIVLLVLIPVGIVLGVLGYRRVTDDGPALAAVHISSSPNGVINRVRGTGGF